MNEQVNEEDVERRADGKLYHKKTGRRLYVIQELNPANRAARRRRQRLAAAQRGD